jgi:negative regulator of replication initiation
MLEIDRITESPEYKNNKYSNSRTKNTIAQKNERDHELDEYNIFDSPKATKSKRRGLVVNASGSKKSITTAFNKTTESLSNTVRVYFDRNNQEIYSDRSHYNNNSSFKDKVRSSGILVNLV